VGDSNCLDLEVRDISGQKKKYGGKKTGYAFGGIYRLLQKGTMPDQPEEEKSVSGPFAGPGIAFLFGSDGKSRKKKREV